jgi:hypothetical protein
MISIRINNSPQVSKDHHIENNMWLILVNSKIEEEDEINQPVSSHSKCKEAHKICHHNPQLYTFIIIFYHHV